MPNHVAHALTVRGPKSELERLIEYTKSPTSAFDFNKIIPMPAELKHTTKGWKQETEEEKNERIAEENRLTSLYGHSNWYDWSCDNWGTKWNAYHGPEASIRPDKEAKLREMSWEERLAFDIPADWYELPDWWGWEGDSELRAGFHTAWSPATPVYEALAEEFPQLLFHYRYADEGGGFVSEEIYEDGRLDVDETYDWESDEGIEIREAVGYYHPEDDEDDIDEDDLAEEAAIQAAEERQIDEYIENEEIRMAEEEAEAEENRRIEAAIEDEEIRRAEEVDEDRYIESLEEDRQIEEAIQEEKIRMAKQKGVDPEFFDQQALADNKFVYSLFGKIGEYRNIPEAEKDDFVQDFLVQHNWTRDGAAELERVARDYGTFFLSNALALAYVLGIEDGDKNF